MANRSHQLRYALQSFAKELEKEDIAAYGTWTWLPTYEVAKKHHGDYAYEFQPKIADILHEVCIVMSIKAGYEPSHEDHEWLTTCPCGEDHQDLTKEMLDENYGMTKE